MTPCLSLLCFMVFGPPGVAFGGLPTSVSATPGTSVQAFGTQNPSCAAWTDACVTCTAAGEGPAACSTPGIACTPGPITCTGQKAP